MKAKHLRAIAAGLNDQGITTARGNVGCYADLEVARTDRAALGDDVGIVMRQLPQLHDLGLRWPLLA